MLIIIAVVIFINLALDLRSGDVLGNSDTNLTYADCNHQWDGPTCAKSARCLLCGKLGEGALGHTTAAGRCERCGESIGDWIIRNYVDHFGDPTSENYLTTKYRIIGTFSNTATTNSKLGVVVLVDDDSFAFDIYEYNDNIVENYYSKTRTYQIEVKRPNGSKITLTGKMYSKSSRLFLDEKDEMQLIHYFKNNFGEYKFFISNKDDMTTWSFSVDASNFYDLIDIVRP